AYTHRRLYYRDRCQRRAQAEKASLPHTLQQNYSSIELRTSSARFLLSSREMFSLMPSSYFVTASFDFSSRFFLSFCASRHSIKASATFSITYSRKRRSIQPNTPPTF